VATSRSEAAAQSKDLLSRAPPQTPIGILKMLYASMMTTLPSCAPVRHNLEFLPTVQTEDFEKQYQTKTDDELLRIAVEASQLCPEAENALKNELSKRRISRRELDTYCEDDRNRRATEKTWDREKTYSLFPSLKGLRATVDDWKRYNRQTGEWPQLSIAFYFLLSTPGC
jgi:hypothetical protein